MIKTHKQLAEFIQGKSVLHMNSLGKDSIACLEWLHYAKVNRIVSLHFEFMAAHPDDKRYLKYLKKRYPKVEFISEPNGHELDNISQGIFQSPIERMMDINKWEHYGFSMSEQARNVKSKLGLDFICRGNSKYEGMHRATQFYKKGLVDNDIIYPLGLMTKSDVVNIIRQTGVKLHPCYKLLGHTIDGVTYYRMRSFMIANKEYEKNVKTVFPLIELDKYRYEVLFK